MLGNRWVVLKVFSSQKNTKSGKPSVLLEGLMFYKNCLGKAEWKVGYAEVSHLLGQQEIGPNCSSVWLFQQANAPEPSVLQMGAQTHNVDGKLGYKYSVFVFFFSCAFSRGLQGYHFCSNAGWKLWYFLMKLCSCSLGTPGGLWMIGISKPSKYLTLFLTDLTNRMLLAESQRTG